MEADPRGAASQLRRAGRDLYVHGFFGASEWCFSQANQDLAEPPSEQDLALDFVSLQALTALSSRDFHRAKSVTAAKRTPLHRHLHLLAAYRQCSQLARARRPRDLRPEPEGPQAAHAQLHTLKQALAAEPGAHALFLRAACARDAGKVAEAARLAGQSLEHFPLNIDAARLLVSCVGSLREFVAAAPANASARYLVALEFAAATRNPVALRALLEQAPEARAWAETPHARVLRALLCYLERRFPEAVELLRRAAPLRAPGGAGARAFDPLAVRILSDAYYVLHSAESLGELARLMEEHFPESVEAAVVRGNVFSLRGEHASAKRCFAHALQEQPRDASLSLLLGHELLHMRRTHDAMEAYRRAAEARLDYRAWQCLGRTYELVGLPQHAEQCFERALERNWWDPRPWISLARYSTGARFSELLRGAAAVSAGRNALALFLLARDLDGRRQLAALSAMFAALWLHVADSANAHTDALPPMSPDDLAWAFDAFLASPLLDRVCPSVLRVLRGLVQALPTPFSAAATNVRERIALPCAQGSVASDEETRAFCAAVASEFRAEDACACDLRDLETVFYRPRLRPFPAEALAALILAPASPSD